jgi:hypothetical protein
MNLNDARSYFSIGNDTTFESLLVDDETLARKLDEHSMEPAYIRDAIVELARFARFERNARKQSRAARTQSGRAFLELAWSEPGIGYGKLHLTVKRAYRRGGVRITRVLEQLERARVLIVTHDLSDNSVSVSVNPELVDELDLNESESASMNDNSNFESAFRPSPSESQIEAMIDSRVQRRLAREPEYLFAENSEEQTLVERKIELEEERRTLLEISLSDHAERIDVIDEELEHVVRELREGVSDDELAGTYDDLPPSGSTRGV